MGMRSIIPLLSLGAAGLTGFGCAEYSSGNLKNSDYAEDADTGAYGAEDPSGDASWDGDDDDLGSETENDFLRLLPATTDKYVFVANPTRNTLTRVSVPSLDVITVDVGTNPDVVVTTQDYTRAVTFNTGSDDLTVINANNDEGLPEVDLEIPVLANLNHMVVSPDGLWAVVYHDSDIEDDGTATGTISYNEISVVNLDTGAHHPMVVGRNPHQVKFTEDSSLAIVVSDDRLALIDLFADVPTRSIVEIADDLLDPPRAEEVELTPDGAYAFIRQYGQPDIVLVDLATNEWVDSLPVQSNPTDLDISPDGTLAVIVDRGAQKLFIYPTENPAGSQPVIIDLPETELLGSVTFSPDSEKAILFTTAANIAHYTTWDLTEPDPAKALKTRPLVAPIRDISITPTGNSMLVIHKTDAGVDSDPRYEHKDVISLIDLGDFLDNPLILPGEPTTFANSASGEVGYVIMEGQPQLTVLAYDQLLHWDVSLKSMPVHVGVLPDTNYAYINQEHDLGRLTFFDPVNPLDGTDDVIQTITGFELNSAIEH
jgi:DNA-binding beta-propeller fold protein YncE